MIEKLKLQDDKEYKYVDEDNISYQSKKRYLQSKILGLCGCGNPDTVMSYIKNSLLNVDKYSSIDDDISYKFFLYWADNNQFTEHGTSINYSWLTERGKELLTDIKWCLENEKDE